MTLTTEQIKAAGEARRILADVAFQAVLDRIVQDAAEKTVFGHDQMEREANRQLVLAIRRIRGELQADADAPEADRADEARNRAME